MADKRGIKAGGALCPSFSPTTLFSCCGLDTAKRRLLQAWGKSLEAIGRPMLALGLGIAATLRGRRARIFEDDRLPEMLALSRRTGASVEELSALSFAAEQANVSSESLEHGIRHLHKSLFEAATGSAEAQMAFTELGVSGFAELSRMTAGGQLSALASGLSKIANPADKAGLAMKLLGRGGTRRCCALLNMGARRHRPVDGQTHGPRSWAWSCPKRDGGGGGRGFLQGVPGPVGANEDGGRGRGRGDCAPQQQEVVRWVTPFVKEASRTGPGTTRTRLLTGLLAVGGGLIVVGGAVVGLGVAVTAAAGDGAGRAGHGARPGGQRAGRHRVAGRPGRRRHWRHRLRACALHRSGPAGAGLPRPEVQRAQGHPRLTSWDPAISAALQSGDLAAAANIAFLGVKVAWLEMTADLVQPYADAKSVHPLRVGRKSKSFCAWRR